MIDTARKLYELTEGRNTPWTPKQWAVALRLIEAGYLRRAPIGVAWGVEWTPAAHAEFGALVEA